MKSKFIKFKPFKSSAISQVLIHIIYTHTHINCCRLLSNLFVQYFLSHCLSLDLYINQVEHCLPRVLDLLPMSPLEVEVLIIELLYRTHFLGNTSVSPSFSSLRRSSPLPLGADLFFNPKTWVLRTLWKWFHSLLPKMEREVYPITFPAFLPWFQYFLCRRQFWCKRITILID